MSLAPSSAIHERQAALMKSRVREQKPLQLDQLVRMQIQEKPFTWSEFGRVYAISDHVKSCQVTPLDGSQDKLRNRRLLKPKEPESYELSGPSERRSSLEDVSIDRGEAPTTRSKSMEDLKNIDLNKRLQSSERLKEFTRIMAPWDQSPAANTRSKTK